MKRVQIIGGTTVNEDARIGHAREITVDTTVNSLRLHDGFTPGGHVIPNITMLDVAQFSRFSAVGVHSVPGVLTNAIQRTLATFSVAGTYSLPLVATIALVGTPIYLQALVSGVTVDVQGADAIFDAGATLTSLALSENEIVEIVKKSAAGYIVLNRY